MAGLDHVVRRLGCVLQAEDAAGTSDAELLKRYVRRADASAFEALVHRHGPLVLRVCRRVLRNAHEADDAFQATFLVLLRKAATLRAPGTLANWQYGVAYRTALHARHAAAHRRSKEAAMAWRVSTPNEAGTAWQALLDRELARLPQTYRAAILLCELQGKTRCEAARQIGCAEGTVASRLVRGRALLAKRLRRHGADPTGTALVTLPCAEEASAAVRPELVSSTMQTVGLHAAAATGGGAAAKAATLADGVLRTMLLAKLKVVLAGLQPPGLRLRRAATRPIDEIDGATPLRNARHRRGRRRAEKSAAEFGRRQVGSPRRPGPEWRPAGRGWPTDLATPQWRNK